jgi:uncharacterized protein with von Willebrand factor type A (vWA) domain
VLRRFGPDYKVVFVGDAAMSPYEVGFAGGAVEHNNAESGATWLERVAAAWPRVAWLNPTPEAEWNYTQSIGMIRTAMAGRMYPLTLDGLERAMRDLAK